MTEEQLTKLMMLIQMAIGEASMSWSEVPQGTFDSERALDISSRLLLSIRELLKV